VKLLGVTLDQHLIFGPHIENVANICQGLLGILAKATIYLPKELLKLMYTALIRSHMEYCSSIFSSAAKTILKKLDVIQRKAARIIYEVPRDAHADLLLLFHKLDALNDRREVHLVNLIKSFISGKYHLCHHWWKHALIKPYVFPSLTPFSASDDHSVFGANLYNQQLALSSDSEDTDTQSS